MHDIRWKVWWPAELLQLHWTDSAPKLRTSLQVALNEVFQRFHDQDPINHAAPIPTVTFSSPVNKTTTRGICYAQRYLRQAKVSDPDIRATAAVIIAAALRLESNADASAIQQNNPDIGNSTVRKYIIKRNHSGFARKVIRLTLDLSNWQPEPCIKGLLGTAPRLHATALSPEQHVSETNQTDYKLIQGTALPDSSYEEQVNDLLMEDPAKDLSQNGMTATPADSTQELPNPVANPALAAATPHARKDAQVGMAEVRDRLHDAQQLLEAAERVLRESCGEAWLLQPLIPDMACNEYRQAGLALRFLLCN